MQADEQIVQQNFYRCKVTNYDDTLGELSFWYDEPMNREMRRESQLYPLVREKKEVSDLPIDPDAETNLQRNTRRAKSKIRKLVMTMKADRMLTLTTREAITDIAVFNKLFVRFIKLLHRKYPNFKYVAVAEMHDSIKTSPTKRYSWHYHLAVSGWQDLGYLRHCWQALVDGQINVTSPKTHGNNLKASPQISGYLTKYITKASNETHDFGKYRYRASNGIDLMQFTIWLQAQTWSEAIKEAGNLLFDTYGSIGAHYFADDWNNGWFASWSFNNSSRKAFNANPTTS